MKTLKEILSEFALNSFPDWNQIQKKIFEQLKKENNLSYDDFVKIATVLRDHMNNNYFSGTWTVNKSQEELFDELLSISKKSLNNNQSL